MKVKNLNLTLEWQTIRNIPDFLKIDTHFPTYNVKVKNENDYLIHQNLNLNNHEFIMEFINNCPRDIFVTVLGQANRRRKVYRNSVLIIQPGPTNSIEFKYLKKATELKIEGKIIPK